MCSSIDNFQVTKTEEIVGNPLCSSRLLLLSDLTTSPKLITSLLINTKISIDLIRERSGTTQFPRFSDP